MKKGNENELKNWQTELNSFVVYKTLSKIEKNNSKGDLFKNLAVESLG